MVFIPMAHDANNVNNHHDELLTPLSYMDEN